MGREGRAGAGEGAWVGGCHHGPVNLNPPFPGAATKVHIVGCPYTATHWGGRAQQRPQNSLGGRAAGGASAVPETHSSGADQVTAAPYSIRPHHSWCEHAAESLEITVVHSGAVAGHCLLQLVGSVFREVGSRVKMPLASSLGSPPPHQQGCAPRLHRC
jgi:hypothetical protein